MPEKKAQAMLAMPIEYIAWLASSRAPVLAARDLPMEMPSSTQSRAIASAGLVRAVRSLTLTRGTLIAQEEASMPLKCATVLSAPRRGR